VEFVGREEELQNLHQLLQDNKQVAMSTTGYAYAAIAGMGGVGKTELALQYAIKYRETYNGGLCWLLAKTGDVGIQVVQFARTQLDLKPPEDFDILAQVQYCWRRWREGDVLLVLDDVNDYEQVKPYLQSLPSRFKVLMTTRQKLGRIAQLSLDVLQPEAALELLKSLLKETPGRIEKELALANQLCEWLGYLPLGVELVGRYLARKQDLSLAEMLRRLENKRLDERSLSKSKSEADMTAQRGVLAAFELSWQELEDSDKQLGCLLSLFAAAPIPWKLVEQCLREEDAEDLEEIRDDRLLNLHLLQRKSEGIYQLHPLLREFFQYKLTGLNKGEELKRSLCGVMVAVAKEIPYTPTLKQITDATPAIPHIAEVANNLIQYVSDDDLTLLFIGNAWFYSGQGLYEQAVAWCEQCLEVTKKRLGKKHLHVATSLHTLGGLYFSQGRCNEVESLYLQALAIRRHLLGEENLDVAQSLNDLGLFYSFQGRCNEVESLYLQALAIRRRLLGEENLDVAQTLNNLALFYFFKGRHNKAEPLYQQALAIRRHLLGEENLDVAQSLNNLALCYKSQKKYSDAEPLYKKALGLQQRLLGDEHHTVATTINNLAGLYKSQNKYSDAESWYKQALEIQRCRLGEEHPNVALILNNLAALYNSQGKYSKAEDLLKQTLDIYEQCLGVNHLRTVTSREDLAYIRDRLPPNPE
jgi:tetratricopeptide (TPR) repeat protein